MKILVARATSLANSRDLDSRPLAATRSENAALTIGGAVSYGCIRMYNADILDLYGRVGFGTQVVVTR